MLARKPRRTSLFVDTLAKLRDPRRAGGNLQHQLVDIVVLCLCGVLVGCEDFVEIENFGRERQGFFRQFLKLPNGIPSHDTLDRVMGMLELGPLQACLLEWLQAVRGAGKTATGAEPEVLAIDGKTLRRTFDSQAGLGALHVVSAWASERGLLLGQVPVDGKSNEIKAIPKLLHLLTLQGMVVTIDAAGCQRDIARQITDQGGDYVLALKDNQPTLHQRVRDYFIEQLEAERPAPGIRRSRTAERGHGRQEVREVTVAPLPAAWGVGEAWAGARTIVMVFREWSEGRNGEPTGHVRCFLSSLPAKARLHSRVIRSHWGVENGLHWVLDVVFREDQRRLRKGQGPANWAMLNRLAVSLLKAERSTKRSLKVKRKVAGWKPEYLLKLLAAGS